MTYLLLLDYVTNLPTLIQECIEKLGLTEIEQCHIPHHLGVTQTGVPHQSSKLQQIDPIRAALLQHVGANRRYDAVNNFMSNFSNNYDLPHAGCESVPPVGCLLMHQSS